MAQTTDDTWTEASNDLISTANKIVKEFYPNLKEARIGFIFRDEAQKSGGKTLLGQTSKVSDKEKVFIDLDFLIWVSEEDWTRADSKTREALVDHLLAHCGGYPFAWKINPHDIEEFSEVIGRRGLWNGSLLGIDGALNHLVDHQGRLLLKEFERVGAVVRVNPSQMEEAERE
jgi:hypothetical protein